MKWIELVRVRSSSTTVQEVMPYLLKQVKEIETSESLPETFLMQHVMYEGDLAVILVWLNDAEPQKTREGLMVAERLRELGPIDHAVWIPVKEVE